MAPTKRKLGLAALVAGTFVAGAAGIGIAASGARVVDDHIVHIGYMAHVPHSEWVDVKNIKPVRDGGNALWADPLSIGDSCRIDLGGKLVVLEFLDDKAVVEYLARDPWDSGTECPSGVKTTISLSYLATMNDEYKAKVKQIMSE